MKTIKIILFSFLLISIKANAQYWNILGNAGTSPTTNFLGTTDNIDLVIRTNNTEKLRVMAGGKVGIGTANPTHKLHVASGNMMLDYVNTSTIGNLYFGDEPENNTGNGMRMFAMNNGSSYIDSRNATSTDGLIFRVSTTFGSTERMRICASGNIGVNVTNPAYKMHVNGDLFVTGGTSSTAGILLGDLNTQAQYGMEYLVPTTGVAGFNFWKPWNSSNGTGGQGFQNYILFLNDDGNVGIGVAPDKISSSYKLSVNGSIRANEIVVETGWADFVFEPNYRLMPLNELETYIKENSHLPNVPSANEVETNGVSVGKMESTLLQKVEELTLYVIDQNKKMEALEKELNNLKSQEQK